jgi:hypothetical protein
MDLAQKLRVIGGLALIAITATLVSLALQRLFGPAPSLIFLGQILAAIGAAGLALCVAARVKP